MAYDLAIWKRSTKTKTAMLYECYEAICEGKDHTAMDFFDEEKFFSEMVKEFGEQNSDYFGKEIDDCPFLFSIGRGAFGNWVHLSLNFSTAQATRIKIIEIALHNGLMVYDPQVKGVWGNRRPPKN